MEASDLQFHGKKCFVHPMHPVFMCGSKAVLWFHDEVVALTKDLKDEKAPLKILQVGPPMRELGTAYFSDKPRGRNTTGLVVYTPPRCATLRYRRIIEDVLNIISHAPGLGVELTWTDPATKKDHVFTKNEDAWNPQDAPQG
jgi:hypothetical protein